MTDETLSGDELERLRDGDAGREPCHDCGVHPVYRPDDPVHWHYFHHQGCSVPERIRQLIDEG
jgi:hypothetical protein